MYYLLFALHGLICFLLCVVILLQSSKGDGLAGAFGGGAGQAVFGTHGVTTFLHKATIYLAVGFMLCSGLLVVMTANRANRTPQAEARRGLEELPVTGGAAVPTTEPAQGQPAVPAPAVPVQAPAGTPAAPPAAGAETSTQQKPQGK